MILYKYLQPARLDVLQHKMIRFTQPGDFNDPFEFRPLIQSVASDEDVRAYVEEHFEQLVEAELAKYGALYHLLPQADLKEILLKQKGLLPDLFRLLEPQALLRISPVIDSVLNLNMGVLCLSEVRDSILMWGHYTDNHRGFVVGFDSDHSFFSKRRTESDEFGFLRQVNYQLQRPSVTLTDTTSPSWFQTKSEHWAYEKEWRIVRVLSEAQHRIDVTPFPVCLFEFRAEAVREIIIGIRSAPSIVREIQSLAAGFPKAALLKALEDTHDYGLIIKAIGY
jgi:hypothetical protein